MISIPVAVNSPFFKWQLELWWWAQKQAYGNRAKEKSHAIVVDRNFVHDTPLDRTWLSAIPHTYMEGCWQHPVVQELRRQDVPLNIQHGLRQILNRFDEEQILEVTDCDMMHIKPHPEIVIRDDMLIVCDLYEAWHLKSLSVNKHVIAPYFENDGRFYNGGFVPIIGKAKTFKKILDEWEAVHRDILSRDYGLDIHWWAGMFALQAACEKRRVTMVADDYCYIPGTNTLKDTHYSVHYSCDSNGFQKHLFPNNDFASLPSNRFYDKLKQWYLTSGYKPQ